MSQREYAGIGQSSLSSRGWKPPQAFTLLADGQRGGLLQRGKTMAVNFRAVAKRRVGTGWKRTTHNTASLSIIKRYIDTEKTHQIQILSKTWPTTFEMGGIFLYWLQFIFQILSAVNLLCAGQIKNLVLIFFNFFFFFDLTHDFCSPFWFSFFQPYDFSYHISTKNCRFFLFEDVKIDCALESWEIILFPGLVRPRRMVRHTAVML